MAMQLPAAILSVESEEENGAQWRMRLKDRERKSEARKRKAH